MKTDWKSTLSLWAFTAWKIPLIFKVRPRVVKLDDQRIKLIIPYKRLNKNHVNSLYFGSLAVGADISVGLLALARAKALKENVVLLFKDFKTDFLRQIRGDALFICEEASEIDDLIKQVKETGQRQNKTISGYVTVPSNDPEEKVMTFELTLSLKKR
jgi:acyl-coenzyme A thioesterase PaaI-like protein